MSVWDVIVTKPRDKTTGLPPLVDIKFPSIMPALRTKSIVALVALFSILWLAANYVLAARFSISGSDGVMYSLPLAFAKHPFDLGIPFLSNFEGYGSAWGHQWPGALWIKGLIFWLVPYSKLADVMVLAVFQWLVAGVAAVCVWRTTGVIWASAAAWIILLSDRLMLNTCWGNRFETIAIAVLLILFADSLETSSGSKTPGTRSQKMDSPRGTPWRWIVRLAAFLCPTVHPYAFALGLLIIAFDLVCPLVFKGAKPRDAFWKVGCFMAGILATIAWFMTQPEALRQFTANLALQKSFFSNWNTVIDGLRVNYRLGGGLLLWGVAFWAGASLAIGFQKRRNGGSVEASALRLLTPSLLLAVFAIHTVTRCENYNYLAFGAPFAVVLICVQAALISAKRPYPAARHHLSGRCIPVVLALLVLSLHATIIPFRILQFIRAGSPDLRLETAEVLAGIPAGRAVYIPHILWPAAAEDRNHEIRWFTFPIASPRQLRERYEAMAYAKAKPGDFLVIDNSTASGVDKFGLKPTFNLSPPDPTRWKLSGTATHLFQGSIQWGVDLSIYEFIESE